MAANRIDVMPDNFSPKLLNIIDANIDRALEGIRFIEDISRFVLQDKEITSRLKESRHRLIFALDLLEIDRAYLAIARKRGNDVGSNIWNKKEFEKDFDGLLLANFSRVQESLRVLEELSKITSIQASKSFKKIRFENYKSQADFFIKYKKQKRMKIFLQSSIYAVVTLQDKSKYVPLISQLLKAGIKTIQFRPKTLADIDVLKIGRKLRQLTAKYTALLIIDDRPDICQALDADGVHLGQEDMPVKYARAMLGEERIIGKSTHSRKQLLAALKEKPDYISIGPIFKTSTVPYKPVGPSLIKYACTKGLPFVAIGGINESSMKIPLKAGAKRIAVVSAFCSAKNPKEAARILLAKAEKLMKKSKKQ